MSVKLGEIDKSTRCADNLCWQRDTCERFIADGPVHVRSQIAGSLRAKWQDQASVCFHYIGKGAVS